MLTRRVCLAGASAFLSGPAPVLAAAVTAESDVLMREVVDGAVSLRPVHTGGRWCEGPVWAPGSGGLVFSDVRADRQMVLGLDERARVLREPSGYANGNAVDRQGRLVTCEHLGRRVVRREADGRLTVLAERFEDRPLNSPNDVAVARDGAVWFTDPTFGLTEPEEGLMRPPEQRGRFLFRLDSAGRLAVAADGFDQPNGLAFSPDGQLLYVSDTGASTNPEGTSEIRVFRVGDGGRLSGERVFARLTQGIPDGLKTDEAGRVWAATYEGAQVWSPDGASLGRIATPTNCGNLAFGGQDGRRLFLCVGTAIYAIDTRTRGAAWAAGAE